ncbi:hypothetical protein LCL63_002569 [Vibrio fluvialis]|nr:hypothetical protein [Vibrio fluvialis]
MRYFLFLKSKKGEFDSIRHINTDGIVPVFDFVSGEKRIDKIESKQDKFINNIKRYHDKSSLIYIDHYDLEQSVRYSDGSHPYEKYHSILSEGYNLGLVTGIDRDNAYNEVFFAYLQNYKNIPVCIRLNIEDVKAPKMVLNEISDLVSEISEYTDRIDIIVDCRILVDDVDSYYSIIKRFILYVEAEKMDCLIVVTGSSIPKVLNDVAGTGDSLYLERKEQKLWDKLNTIPTDYVSITYGDYGVVSPEFEDIQSDEPIPIVPKITYSFKNEYFIIRGFKTNLHEDGYGQYKTLAGVVKDLADFRDGYSYGEDYIVELSDSSNKKVGNPTTWITATTVQHLHFINSLL